MVLIMYKELHNHTHAQQQHAVSHPNGSNASTLRRTDHTKRHADKETRKQILKPCQKPGSRGQLNRQFSAC